MGVRGIGRVLVLLALIVPLLAGCGKVELYSSLSEQEANEILAALSRHGIACTKVAHKEGLVAISVPSDSAARAIDILHSVGLPHEKFARMGDIFRKEGLISSPLEERVRFLYGLQQEVAGTIAKIDGVIAARVNLVVPEEPRGITPPKPSSAAVFLKVRPDINLEPLIPQIKLLVTNSIEGLNYDKVMVLLFPATPEPRPADGPPLKTLFGIRIDAGSADTLWLLIGSLGGLLALALMGNVVLAAILVRRRAARAADGGNG